MTQIGAIGKLKYAKQIVSDKTTFTSYRGLHSFTRMPFGPSNSAGTIQSARDVMLSAVKWQFALVYLQDIVIFSRTPAEHIAQVHSVLTHLNNAGVTLRLKKCFSSQNLMIISDTLFAQVALK